MADFTLLIRERVNLEGTERGTDYNLTIPDIIYSDNRIFNIPSGSEITIFSLGDTNGAGQFVTSSLKYARISNHSDIPVTLTVVTGGGDKSSYNIATKGSFMLSSHLAENDSTPVLDFGDYISQLVLTPSGSSAKVEYFIATT